MAEKCRHLRYLRLHGMFCSSRAFIAMTTYSTGIINLDLSFTAVTDEVIESVAVNLKNLRRLNLQDCMQMTNTSLQSLATHRASTLELLWLCDSAHISSDAVVSLKHAVPGIYVHWQLTLDSTESIRMSPTDYAVTTELCSYSSMQNVLPVAQQCALLTVLCVLSKNLSADEFDVQNMTKLACCCPKLRTLIIGDCDLHAVQAVSIYNCDQKLGLSL